ncbi:MAG: ribosome recycling factor [Planctomycetes bacterium]|nr:ribosome recycling factor [Planctomycetota bacterium]
MSSPIEPFIESAIERMDKSVQHFLDETRGIRTGRASAGLLDSVRVDYYGQKTPLGQIANVSVADSRCLLVKPFDAGVLKDIERSILASDLGLNPTIESGALRINIPALSQEQRHKLASRVKSLSEDARVAMRNVRRDVLREIEVEAKDKNRDVVLSEDDVKQGKTRVQDVLKEHETKIDELCKNKSEEIMTV